MYCDAPLIICALGVQYSIPSMPGSSPGLMALPKIILLCERASCRLLHYCSTVCFHVFGRGIDSEPALTSLVCP